MGRSRTYSRIQDLTDYGGTPLAGQGLAYNGTLFVPASYAGANVVTGADPTGAVDATAAFQAALAPGVTTVVPPGKYLFAGSLAMPTGSCLTTLGGQMPSLQRLGGSIDYGALTTLMPTANSGNAAGTPFITPGRSSTIRGLNFFYPNQAASATTPIAYPWTIAPTAIDTDDVSIENCSFFNAYQAINCSRSARWVIRHIVGDPILYGIQVDGSTDCGHIDNIHFWPFNSFFGSAPSGLGIWTHANGEAFRFGRSDEQFCRNAFAFGYNYGFHFYNGAGAGSYPGTTYGEFANCSTDQCNAGLQFDATTVTGCRFTGGSHPSSGTNCVTFNAGFTGTVNLNQLGFWASAQAAVGVNGAGFVSISDCDFAYWNNGSAISVNGTGSTRIQGNQFPAISGGTAHLIVGSSGARGYAADNLTRAGWTTTSNASSNFTVGTNY